MFTGLVGTLGSVVSVARNQSGCSRLVFASSFSDLAFGESVAIDGACMTVADIQGGQFGVDVMPESLRHTTLGRVEVGGRVNLERALRVGDRLGGHFVSGHVDALARVSEIQRIGEDHRVVLEPPGELMRFLAHKGSVTLAGVSLTVSAVARQSFEVALIPVTLEHTTLGELVPGQGVNLEVDLVARYLERLVSRPHDKDGPHE